MKVYLINYTKDAKELLIFSKKTRLKMNVNSFEDIKNMSEEEKNKEIDYVFGTIGSSWEFIDYTFLIEGVTRAFTHQLVRHRVGVSFAQQAQRVVNMSDFEYISTGNIKNNEKFFEIYKDGMDMINKYYEILIRKGAHPQDARGILPTNITTNILMKINLRSLSSMLNTRLCIKAQDEFQDVARELRKKTLEIHPWTKKILQVHCVQHGNCAFPNYEDCPIKKKNLIKNFDRKKILNVWESKRSEYQPKEDK